MILHHNKIQKKQIKGKTDGIEIYSTPEERIKINIEKVKERNKAKTSFIKELQGEGRWT